MLSEARSLPCFQLVFDVAISKSSIGSVKLDLEYFKYSRSSLTEPIDDLKVTTSKTSWKHRRLRWLANCFQFMANNETKKERLFEEILKIEGLEDRQIIDATEILMGDSTKLHTFYCMPDPIITESNDVIEEIVLLELD
uniref:Uncharacterized protein n=1 Tax=Ananas comosus var. bracteatus TaxID=296719 RepID=A0A6V7PPF5_ANACO|nr:unnamed protein product [Ananas comosus var. bracteatus]